MTRTALRLAAVLAFALSTSACSTIDDMFSDDTPATTPAADQNGFPPDTAPPATTADSGTAATPAASPLASGTEAATPGAAPPSATPGTVPPSATASTAPDATGTTPDLAAIPEKPSGTTSPDEQKEVADSLGADRGRATYSSEALRGGTEPAAPPPGAPEPATPVAAATPPPAASDATPPPADQTPAPASQPPAPADQTPPPASEASPSPAPTTAVASAPMTPPPGTQPAVPPGSGGIPGSQPMAMSDAALGFKPSTAPALDSSISQFVAQPIIARYQQTAANAGIATSPIAPLAGDVAAVAPTVRGRRNRGVGGPEAMSGSVVANLDAINAAPPSVYANASGMPPTAVVMFPGDTISLNATGRAQVRAAVEAFQQRGGTGFIKVVGHSSSRTPNMPVEKHLIAIFAKSQKRAQAVAAEIIKEGVPASRVLVEAVGDSQPVYYESMPQGEDGNRRAEIFLQN